jgi:hypothetical protein
MKGEWRKMKQGSWLRPGVFLAKQGRKSQYRPVDRPNDPSPLLATQIKAYSAKNLLCTPSRPNSSPVAKPNPNWAPEISKAHFVYAPATSKDGFD